MSERSPVEELGGEHKALSAHITDIQETVRGLDAGAEASWAEHGAALRDGLEMFHRSLLLHFRKEEEGLFPDARDMVSQRGKGAEVLGPFFSAEAEDDMSAHSVLRTRAEDMLALLEQIAQAGGPDQESLGRLRALVNLTKSLLDRHADKEDKLIFPIIERSLDAAQIEKIGERMAAVEPGPDPTDSTMRHLGY